MNTCKKCKVTPTPIAEGGTRNLYRPTEDVWTYLASWVDAFSEVIPTETVEALTIEHLMPIRDQLRAGSAAMVGNPRRGREVTVMTMTTTGTLFVSAPQGTTTTFEDRLLVSTPVTVGVVLEDLHHVSPKTEHSKACKCTVNLRGGLGDEGRASSILVGHEATRGAEDGARHAALLLGYSKSDLDPEEYLAVRQSIGWNPQSGIYDYAAEGYAPQMAKAGHDVGASTLMAKLFDF